MVLFITSSELIDVSRVIERTIVLIIHHLLRLNEASVSQMDLKDCSLIERHVSIVSTLKRNEIASFDDIRL